MRISAALHNSRSPVKRSTNGTSSRKEHIHHAGGGWSIQVRTRKHDLRRYCEHLTKGETHIEELRESPAQAMCRYYALQGTLGRIVGL